MIKPKITVVAALIFDSEKRILITRRPEGQDMAGYWEFPGGRIEPDETSAQALIREIDEELALDISVGALLHRDNFEYETKIVDISFYFCKQTNQKQKPQCLGVADWKYIPLTQLYDYKFPAADEAVILLLTAPETTLDKQISKEI
jgi:8-oxo-dGTP diphosphatase